ncbi:COG4315 family predicted lipoprotein [Spirillospora sp. CA-294931]|uniref:COG4315 family predicted lipoprotein n=1 Tax=Spirillospora sp. CA-294931 TaxID=3240042 RepID=UPI003D920B65
MSAGFGSAPEATMRGTLLGGVFAAVLAATGCAGGTESMETPGKTLAPASSGRAMVMTGRTAGGTALVDGMGKALYLFEKEGRGRPLCDGDCAAMWPPFVISGTPKADGEARGDLLGSVTRADGTEQVTYAGHPLYTYVKDVSPGDAGGRDLFDHGAEWYLLDASGARIRR